MARPATHGSRTARNQDQLKLSGIDAWHAEGQHRRHSRSLIGSQLVVRDDDFDFLAHVRPVGCAKLRPPSALPGWSPSSNSEPNAPSAGSSILAATAADARLVLASTRPRYLIRSARTQMPLSRWASTAPPLRGAGQLQRFRGFRGVGGHSRERLTADQPSGDVVTSSPDRLRSSLLLAWSPASHRRRVSWAVAFWRTRISGMSSQSAVNSSRTPLGS
jgi:hypothetical protein